MQFNGLGYILEHRLLWQTLTTQLLIITGLQHQQGVLMVAACPTSVQSQSHAERRTWRPGEVLSAWSPPLLSTVSHCVHGSLCVGRCLSSLAVTLCSCPLFLRCLLRREPVSHETLFKEGLLRVCGLCRRCPYHSARIPASTAL